MIKFFDYKIYEYTNNVKLFFSVNVTYVKYFEFQPQRAYIKILPRTTVSRASLLVVKILLACIICNISIWVWKVKNMPPASASYLFGS